MDTHARTTTNIDIAMELGLNLDLELDLDLDLNVNLEMDMDINTSIEMFDCSAAEEEIFGPKENYKHLTSSSLERHRHKTYRFNIDGQEISVTGTDHMVVAHILMLRGVRPYDYFLIWEKKDAWWSLNVRWLCHFRDGEVQRFRTVRKGIGHHRKVRLPDSVLAGLNSQAGVDYSLYQEVREAGKRRAAVYRPLPHPPPMEAPKLFPEWNPAWDLI